MRDLTAAVSGYAERFHATVGDEHHVASPLGAWLLLALAAAADPQDERLAGVLGMPPRQATELVTALLEAPHPLVAAATAVWTTPLVNADRLARWRLPKTTEVGPLPDQAALDAWARDHTYGLIERFPLTRTPRMVLLLGSALATKVSWRDPFDVGPATLLGAAGPWHLNEILISKKTHRAFIADTRNAGRVIVHIAAADGGLEVRSVAAAPDIPPSRVIAAAHEDLQPISLYDLPLGETDLWQLREQDSPQAGAEHHRALLPAWSATSKHQLSDPALGFGTATELLAPLLDIPADGFEAAQSATARYSRDGFEAAAVTGFAVLTSAMVQRGGTARFADLRFSHPYAVTAIATHPDPWSGVPVFSAWVATPEEP